MPHTTYYPALALALLLALRKRTRLFQHSDYNRFRILHGGIAALTIALAALHTAMELGHNIHRLLLITFLGVNITGAIAGAGAAIEAGGIGRRAGIARRLRPLITWWHYLLLWVFPVFLLFHVLSVYYF